MDNIFGIGLPELILILVIAGMVMGPERIVRAARSFGRLAARMQAVSRSFFRQLNAELESVDQDGQLRDTVTELNSIRREIAELQRELLSVSSGTKNDVQVANRTLRKETDNAILPPDLRELFSSDPLPSIGAQAITPPLPANPDGPSRASTPSSNGTVSADKPPETIAKRPRRLEIVEDPD